MSVIAANKMIPHATAHLKEDSSDDFLGTETSGSRTEIKQQQQRIFRLNCSSWLSRVGVRVDG